MTQFSKGRYAMFMPDRLRARYEQARTDPELLALRDDLATVDARLCELMKRVDSGISHEFVQQVNESLETIIDAQGRGDREALNDAFRTHAALIRRAMSDYAAWSNIFLLMEQRRKLVESERHRLVQMQQMITVEQAMTLVSSLVEIIKDHVPEPSALAAISYKVSLLLTRNASQQPEPVFAGGEGASEAQS